MSQEQAFPVIVISGHECMGCGKTGVPCVELGVEGGLTLACRECTNQIFDRAIGAVEKRNINEQDEVEVIEESDEEPETIRVEVDLSENDTDQ